MVGLAFDSRWISRICWSIFVMELEDAMKQQLIKLKKVFKKIIGAMKIVAAIFIILVVPSSAWE
jgi:hypothetical protein